MKSDDQLVPNPPLRVLQWGGFIRGACDRVPKKDVFARGYGPSLSSRKTGFMSRDPMHIANEGPNQMP